MIESLKLKLKRKGHKPLTIDLSPQDAQELRDELCKLFGGPKETIIYRDRYPCYWPTWTVTYQNPNTCTSGQVETGTWSATSGTVGLEATGTRTYVS